MSNEKSAPATSSETTDPMTRRRDAFIRRLAVYLVEGQARRSIELEMGKPSAKEWAELRGHVPLHGYPTVDEAEATLRVWLLGEQRTPVRVAAQAALANLDAHLHGRKPPRSDLIIAKLLRDALEGAS